MWSLYHYFNRIATPYRTPEQKSKNIKSGLNSMLKPLFQIAESFDLLFSYFFMT